MRSGDITVAVATCGEPAKLGRCLGALRGGSAQPGEVVVVDQAASTTSEKIVEQLAPWTVRYLAQPRLGLAASRNLALASAAGAALAVIDDDCVPDRGWLDAIAGAFERHPYPDAVTGPILALGDRPPGAYAVSLRESLQAQDHRGQVLPWTIGSGANFASSCELLREVGGWDERLGTGSPGRAAEDTDLYYRLLRRGSMIRYEPAAQVRHEWQSWTTRLARRASYGFGMGALCGMWLRRGDPYALRMLLAYSTMHVRRLGRAVLRGDGRTTREHAHALLSVAPGLFYGVRATGEANP